MRILMKGVWKYILYIWQCTTILIYFWVKESFWLLFFTICFGDQSSTMPAQIFIIFYVLQDNKNNY